jgi:hypothetical protein
MYLVEKGVRVVLRGFTTNGVMHALKLHNQRIRAHRWARVAHGRTRMIVLPLRRSVRLKVVMASSRVATVPMFVRSRPSRPLDDLTQLGAIGHENDYETVPGRQVLSSPPPIGSTMTLPVAPYHPI